MKIIEKFTTILITVIGTLIIFTWSIAAPNQPASSSANFQLVAQAMPALAGVSASANFRLVHSGGEAAGGGQESASQSYGLRSGFWLGSLSTVGPLYLPAALSRTCYLGQAELEPNDNTGQASGALCAGRDYAGTPNDAWDFFYFNTYATGQITVDLTGHPLAGVNGTQIYLFYQSTANQVGVDFVGPAYQIVYSNAPAGTYFIGIYNDTSKCSGGVCNTAYTLAVEY